jgi:hypothetical protein
MPKSAVPPGGLDWPAGKITETSYRTAIATYHYDAALPDTTLARELSDADTTPGWITTRTS